jgi:hypothetical protein
MKKPLMSSGVFLLGMLLGYIALFSSIVITAGLHQGSWFEGITAFILYFYLVGTYIDARYTQQRTHELEDE